ncbi:hypothetical protein SprV_0301070200 [Sparganum proliferum]
MGELKTGKDLVIVPAEKGRATVVLDRTDYLQKAKGLLEDRQLALENSGAITPTDRRMARLQDTAVARFYGLPKVHKDGAPLRPIVSLKGTPTYGLAKWLFRRFKFLTAESDTAVSSSAQFLEKLKGLCPRTYFTFDGTIYEQLRDTPKDSPISGFIAEAVLQRLESLVFQHHKTKFWARYVDDTFVVIEWNQLLTFKEHLNAVFPDIQFTMEEEENNQLAFLDVFERLLRDVSSRGSGLEPFIVSGAVEDKARMSEKPEDSSEREWPNTLQRCTEMTPALKLRLIRRDPATHSNSTRPKFSLEVTTE